MSILTKHATSITQISEWVQTILSLKSLLYSPAVWLKVQCNDWTWDAEGTAAIKTEKKIKLTMGEMKRTSASAAKGMRRKMTFHNGVVVVGGVKATVPIWFGIHI